MNCFTLLGLGIVNFCYKLFAEDAIRIPPGSELEHGPDEIRQGEQRDYDIAKWTVQSRALDALRIDDDCISA